VLANIWPNHRPARSLRRPENIEWKGTFHIGMGEKFSACMAQIMTAGTYGCGPDGPKHFVWAEGGTVLQFHGSGPWSVEYVNSADGPRKSEPVNTLLGRRPKPASFRRSRRRFQQ